MTPELVERAFVAALRARCRGARYRLGDDECADRMGLRSVDDVAAVFDRDEQWDGGAAVTWSCLLGCLTPNDVIALSNATWRQE
jgi:hypothetical protein